MRFILVAFIIFFSSQSFAGNKFYWTGLRSISVHFPSVQAACDDANSLYGATTSSIKQTSSSPEKYMCYSMNPDTGKEEAGWGVDVSTDNCTSEQQYSNETKQCEEKPSQCKSMIGQTGYFATDTPKFELCVNKCTAAVTDVATFKSKAEQKTFYSYSVEYTGEDCNDSATGETAEQPPPPTAAEKSEDCTPTATGPDGSKSSTCTNTSTTIDNQGCVAKGGSVGSINGVMGCVAASKGPKATETKTSTKQTTSTDQATGVTTVKKETTTTQTSCSGNATCVTNNTTVTNNTKTNADGTSAGGTSTCTGAKCGKDGEAEAGEDDGKEEEDEGIEGPTKSLGQGDKGDFTEANTEWDAKVEAVKGELSDKIEEYKTLFSGKFDLNLGEGGGKLTCDTFPVDFGRFGSTTIRFCPNDYAEYLVYLKYALILGASVIAAMIILRD